MKKLSFIICVLASLVSYADPVTVPNIFSAGTPAKASEVNANFNALANAVNSLSNPLMVYDSTGRSVGLSVAYSYSSNLILMNIDGVSFYEDYDESIRTSCGADPTTSCSNFGERYITWKQTSVSSDTITYYYEDANCMGTEYLDRSTSMAGDLLSRPYNKTINFYYESNTSGAINVTTNQMYSTRQLAYVKIFTGTPQLIQPASYKSFRDQVCIPYANAWSPYALGYKLISTLSEDKFNFIPPLSIR